MATKKCAKCDWKAPVLLIKSRVCHRGTTSSRRSPVSQSWSRLDGALLLLRIACAAVFPYHGSAILFGVLGGPGPQNFSAFPRTRDHWLPRRARAGCRRARYPHRGVVSRWRSLHHHRDDWRDFPCSYFPRVRRWQRRLRICVRSTPHRFSLLLTGPGAYSLAAFGRRPCRSFSPTRSAPAMPMPAKKPRVPAITAAASCFSPAPPRPLLSRSRSCREGLKSRAKTQVLR